MKLTPKNVNDIQMYDQKKIFNKKRYDKTNLYGNKILELIYTKKSKLKRYE